MTGSVGVCLGPTRISEDTRQTVLDAAALLQLRRSEAAAMLARGKAPGGEIVARGCEAMNRWMFQAALGWRELVSVRPAATVAELRVSLPNNRMMLARGLKMVSVFDHDRLDHDARRLLTGEDDERYLFGFATVQMKIVDRSHVLLQGPFEDGEPSIMALHAPAFLEAAWRYWHAVAASSFPAVADARELEGLTPRQRQIVAMLATDVRDEDIAATLGVSVRTVRSDIAALMSSLGVRSRFSAGLRLRLPSSVEA